MVTIIRCMLCAYVVVVSSLPSFKFIFKGGLMFTKMSLFGLYLSLDSSRVGKESYLEGKCECTL
jgi:hypothetical protein